MKMDNRSAAELVQDYRGLARAWGVALDAAKPETANARFAGYVSIYCELKRRGPEALGALLALLGDDDAYVALAAATLILEVFPESAEPVLEKLSSEREIVGIVAEMTLKEWRAGRMIFPE